MGKDKFRKFAAMVLISLILFLYSYLDYSRNVRKDARAVGPLVAALKDENRHVRKEAAWALAVEPPIAALKGKDWSVREEAARALVKVGSPAVGPLIAALEDGNPNVREKAARALGGIKDARAVEPLIAALKDRKLEIVAGAYAFFIRRGEPGSEYILIEALNKFGYGSMAEDFLNCGNSKLKKAAIKWAKRNDYLIIPSREARNGPVWGIE